MSGAEASASVHRSGAVAPRRPLQHFQQAVIRRKDRFCLGYFPNVKTYFPEKLCWAIPYEGAQAAADFHLVVYRLIADMESHGLRAGYNNGQGSP